MRFVTPEGPFHIPDLPAVMTAFGRPVFVLAQPQVGAVCLYGTGGVDGMPWTIDIDYFSEYGPDGERVALVRTHRPVDSRIVDRDPLSLLRSTLGDVLANGSRERDARAVVDAAVSEPGVVRVDGEAVECVSLVVEGHRAFMVEHGDVVVAAVLAVPGDVELITVPSTR